MAGGDGRAAAAAVEVALALDDLTLESDERAAAVVTDAAAVALDDAPKLRGIEDVARERRVRGDRLDAVDDLGEGEFVGFEVREEVEREFDALVACGLGHGSGANRTGAG